MIITYPTGFYSTLLPVVAGDGGNVTYTISNRLPPRADPLLFLQIPPGVERRLRPAKSYSTQERRAAMAGRIYSVARSAQEAAAAGTKQFEAGQIVDFPDDEVEISQANLLPLAAKTEIRNDTNLLDLTALGLSVAEVDLLAAQSSTTFLTLQNELNATRAAHRNAAQELNDSQKAVNEANKALVAIETIIAKIGSTVDLTTAQAKIAATLETLAARQAVLTSSLTTLSAQAITINDQLMAVAQLVR